MHGQHGAAGTLVCACWPFLVVLATPVDRLMDRPKCYEYYAVSIPSLGTQCQL